MSSSRLLLLASGLLLMGGAVYLVATSVQTDQARSGEKAHAEIFPEEEADHLREASSVSPKTQRSSNAEVDTPYGAWLGIEFSHEVRFESIVEITAGETTQVLEHILSGRQRVRIVERTHEGFVAAYSWPDLDYRLIEDGVRATEEDTESLIQELRRPVLVYHDDTEDPRGVQQGLRFTPGLEPTTRNWVRTMVACQRAPISREHPEGVDLVEADASGRYRTHYTLEEHRKDLARVSRTKLEALDTVNFVAVAEAPMVSGEGSVTLSRGWVEDAEWQERSVLVVEEANLRITHSFSATIQRTSVDLFAGDGLDGWTLEEDWRSFDGSTEQEEVLAGASEALDAALLMDADVETLVSRMVSLDLMNDRGAEALLAAERLALLIAEDPTPLDALKQDLSSGSLPAGAAARILGSIATAGTAEAQAALRELFMLPNPPDGLRESTALALFQLKSVSPETVRTFHNVLSDEDADGGLRSTSWLLLGAFASTGSDPELASRLVGMESAARDAGEIVSWLEALGNTRSPHVFDAARAHLKAADANTRLSAVRALRHLDSPETTQALIEPASQDPDATVRAEALSLLVGRTQKGALSVAGELLREEPEATVRRAALEALVNRPMDEELHQLLSAVASTDPDGTLRAFAFALLGS